MVFSNKSICISYDKFKVLVFLIREKRALFACSAMCFYAALNAPLRDKYMPRYLNSLTISSSLLLRQNYTFLLFLSFENIMTLVFSVFTVNFYISQYFWKALSDCWCSSGFSPKINVSSAYS